MNKISTNADGSDILSAELNLEDPFDDPALVTNLFKYIHNILAFLDILWQDANGNSALMLAAAENRVLHVKGILTMAVDRGTLRQVLEMRNNEGLTALDMAVSADSETCAMLIKRFSKEGLKTRPRLRGMSFSKRSSGETNEDDIAIELEDGSTDPKLGSFVRKHSNFNNNKSAHVRFAHQRTISGDSLTSFPSSSPTVNPPETSKIALMGEKLRSIFASKKENIASQQNSQFSPEKEKEEPVEDNSFRSSPWSQPGHPVRLPPLANLRRRATSRASTLSLHERGQIKAPATAGYTVKQNDDGVMSSRKDIQFLAFSERIVDDPASRIIVKKEQFCGQRRIAPMKSVIFSDDTKSNLDDPDGCNFYWRGLRNEF
uniref:ANK_REP_REGION domain-containing protein n=1 Tax=Heterorhabditis bacteriophora TaxID=37862 RepID=A0A1I7X0R4_HETBA